MTALYALIACAVASWFAYRAFTAADEPDYMGEPDGSPSLGLIRRIAAATGGEVTANDFMGVSK